MQQKTASPNASSGRPSGSRWNQPMIAGDLDHAKSGAVHRLQCITAARGVFHSSAIQVRWAHLYWDGQQRRQKQDGRYSVQRGAPARQCLSGLPAPEVQALQCENPSCCILCLIMTASDPSALRAGRLQHPTSPHMRWDLYLNDKDANCGKPLQLEPGCLQSRAWTCVPVSQEIDQCHAACKLHVWCLHTAYASIHAC
jgi:hypothetical protein